MALKAKKPSVVDCRMKALFYGSAGVGKTIAAIQFDFETPSRDPIGLGCTEQEALDDLLEKSE